ncbi:MAG TPA: NAD(+) diphosphatase [Thermoleophilaceae bacterium]|nr:NAD(+) diphosphatase [Thermoleophilaceae bacterium]
MIVFSGAALDRAAAARRRPEWLRERRADPAARSVLMSERGVWLDGRRLALALPSEDAVFLGLSRGSPMFADDVTGAEPSAGHPAGLREAATELPAAEAALAAYAGSLVAWHRRHRFCSNCGAPTEQRDGGHERFCPACAAHHFPRTDPVVIVRVTDGGDGLLLGRQARWPEGRFSLLAGYVEPGETLEEAVRREVLEESGVALQALSYLASQPWPFPSSLMLGFSAVAERGRPAPADDELAEVRWFEREEVERAARGQSGLMLSPPFSIARRLIDDWLAAAR